LNEEAPNEEEPIQIDEAQQTQLAGGQQGNNLGKMSHNFISASSMSARIEFDICKCADLASLHAWDLKLTPFYVPRLCTGKFYDKLGIP
jgi:hypothetical protein